MGKLVSVFIQYVLIPFSLIFSVHLLYVCGNEVIPNEKTPFYNLIPRFKIPLGNLLRYKIPQWEVLYFLKYGVVPFIFYDPNFNRTSFITQVQKFKMYFGTEQPEPTTQASFRDDKSLREFLTKHGYPNYEQLQISTQSPDNNTAEEIEDLLGATSKGGSLDLDEKAITEKLQHSSQFSPLGDSSSQLDDLSTELLPDVVTPSKEKMTNNALMMRKRNKGNPSSEEKKWLANFWSSFVHQYPPGWKYTGSLSKFLIDQDSSTGKFRYSSAVPKMGLNRETKSIRGFNVESSGGADTQRDTGSGSTEPRKEKNFQTQGW